MLGSHESKRRNFMTSKPSKMPLEEPFGETRVRIWSADPTPSLSLAYCRWEITAYFRSLPETGSSEEANLWIPTDTKQWQQPPLITPIKSMSSEPLCLQLYLEHPSLSESML
ncbi:hypothetical protein RIF29_38716 [Crotalaria pallida]|uniref:Uncharacterized protein n=1 Tax=Crotalaria pallida TaxID=3830 RepID=A0AAN9HSN8_CROPI